MIDPVFKNGIYIVKFVDDAGQIHFVESGIAAIPEIDEIHYVFSCCGKKFDYASALSRFDNRNYVCRICGASEALDAAVVKDKETVLDEIRELENG